MVISKEDFQNYNNNVGGAFTALQIKMKILLKTANLQDLRAACVAQMHTPGGAKVSEELVKNILTAQTIDYLFEVLESTPYWSWIDIQILEMIVTASDNDQALQLLDNYKGVVFSKRLFGLLPDVLSMEVTGKDYVEVVTKIDRDHSQVTVADLLEFQSQLETIIMDIKEGTCILGHVQEGCIEAHWYIPTSCVDGAYQNARANRYRFNDLSLLYVRIGNYPVIHDPRGQTDVVIPVPSPSVNIGK